MKRAVLFALVPLLLPAAGLTVDHVTVAGKDLKQLQASLAGIGLTSEFGGAHSNHATQMALTSFPDGSYLELIALQTNPDAKAVAAHYWSKHINGNAGPAAWAARATDLAADAARLRATGAVVSPATRSGRERPDKVRLEWESAQVGVEPNGTFFPFLIHDFTPRPQRAWPSGKPTTTSYSGIASAVIAVKDLKASIARYRQAFGLPAPAEQSDAAFGARLASFKDTPVILAQPLDAKSWLTGRLNQFGEGPCAFLLRGTPAASQAEWFGTPVSWFDAAKLGWRLGVQR